MIGDQVRTPSRAFLTIDGDRNIQTERVKNSSVNCGNLLFQPLNLSKPIQQLLRVGIAFRLLQRHLQWLELVCQNLAEAKLYLRFDLLGVAHDHVCSLVL